MNYQDRVSQSMIDSYTSGASRVEVNIGKKIGEAWSIMQNNIGIHILSGLLLLILGIIAPFMHAGYFIGLFDERTKNEKMSVGKIFSGFDVGGKIVWYYLIAIGIGIVMAGIMLAIMFGAMAGGNGEAGVMTTLIIYPIMFILSIALNATLFYAIYLMVFSSLSGMECIKASYAIFNKNKGKTIIMSILVVLLQAAGGALCYVGALITMPLTVITIYLACEELFHAEGGKGGIDDMIDHLV